MDGRDDPQSLALQGWLRFVQGDYDSAIDRFEASLTGRRKQTRKRNLYLAGLPGVLHLLALLHRGARADCDQVQKLVQICLRADMTDLVEPAHRLLGELAMVLAGQRRLDDCAWLQHGLTMRGAFPILLQALALSWLGKRPPAEMQSALADGARQAVATGEVARVLGEAGLRVPVSVKARLLQGLAAVAPNCDIGGGENAAETVVADPRPPSASEPARCRLGRGVAGPLARRQRASIASGGGRGDAVRRACRPSPRRSTAWRSAPAPSGRTCSSAWWRCVSWSRRSRPHCRPNCATIRPAGTAGSRGSPTALRPR